MAGTVQDLDAALDSFEQAFPTALAEIQTTVDAILQKVGPTVDLTVEVGRLQAAQQKLQDAADAIQTQGQGTQPPPQPLPDPGPAPEPAPGRGGVRR